MKIYAISGLGADRRVFDFLQLENELVPIEWIDHKEHESIQEYSKRLSEVIKENQEFALLGVSFGGLVAMEISKVLKPKLTILVSSVETRDELKSIFKGLGTIGIIKVLPKQIFDPPRRIAQFIFGAQNRTLLNEILDDSNLDFAKWAVGELTSWRNQIKLDNVVRIHGTDDKLIPWKGRGKVHLIKKGGHFMIVDKALEISDIINKEIGRNED